jgi:hypothetical protein
MRHHPERQPRVVGDDDPPTRQVLNTPAASARAFTLQPSAPPRADVGAAHGDAGGPRATHGPHARDSHEQSRSLRRTHRPRPAGTLLLVGRFPHHRPSKPVMRVRFPSLTPSPAPPRNPRSGNVRPACRRHIRTPRPSSVPDRLPVAPFRRAKAAPLCGAGSGAPRAGLCVWDAARHARAVPAIAVPPI